MKPIRKKTSGEDIAAIKKGYREGVSMSALGRQFKMTRTAIKRRLERTYRGTPPKILTYKRFPKMGKTYAEIAKAQSKEFIRENGVIVAIKNKPFKLPRTERDLTEQFEGG